MKIDSHGWVPDMETIRWASGVLHEDRIAGPLSAEVADQLGDVEPGSDDWWTSVASIAIEHISVDLHRQAAAWIDRVAGTAGGA